MCKRILFIATGGTIAAGETASGLAPQLDGETLLQFVPEIQSLCRVTVIQLCELDSTDITPDIWLKITDCIEQNYAQVDGFVVTHGTDTLAFTAAALSYLIQESEKPVVLTGAQNPIDTGGSDAPKNLFDAFLYAVSGAGGVSVVFGGRVIASTHAKKLYTRSAAAKKNKEQSKVLSRIKHARCRVYLHTGCFGKHFACRGRNLRRFDFGILWLGRCACVFG